MLKTNSKKAKQNLMEYIRSYATERAESDREWKIENGEPVRNIENDNNLCAIIYETFEAEKYYPDSWTRAHGMTAAEAFKDWAQGLAFDGLFCYYCNRSAVDDLGAILEENEAEKARFSESDAEEMLTRLIFREIEARRIKADAPEMAKTEEPEKASALESIREHMKEGFNDLAAAAKNTTTAAPEPARA